MAEAEAVFVRIRDLLALAGRGEVIASDDPGSLTIADGGRNVAGSRVRLLQ